jgi:hypothetical protein
VAIPLYESIHYPNAPAERLGPGVARINTRGGLLDPSTLAINEARVAEVLAELREVDTRLCVDIETVQTHPGEYWVAHDQSRVDALLSALAALRAYIRSERPGTLVGYYAWFWPSWHAYIPGLSGEPFRREHLVSRLAMYGESEVTDWADFVVVDLYPQFALADSPTYWRPFIQGHLADIRDALPGMEVVAFYHNTLDARVLEKGHMAWLLAEAESAGYDGACVWVPDGGHFLTHKHVTFRDWTVPAVTTDPEAWSAAGEVTLRVRLRWTWYDVTADFAGVTDLDEAAERLEEAINAAIDARPHGGTPNPASPWDWIREHPGTVSVAWDAVHGRMVFNIATDDVGPPHWTEILTLMDFAAAGEAAVSSLLNLASVGSSYDLIDVDPWTGGWVLSGGEPVDWARELIEAASETGGGGSGMSTTSPANHTSYLDTGSGGDVAVESPFLATTNNDQFAIASLSAGGSTNWTRGTNNLNVSGLASGNPVSIINLRVEAAKDADEEDDGTLHVRLVSSTGDVLSDTKTFTINSTVPVAMTLGGDDWGGVTADELIAGVRIEWRVTTGEVNGGNYAIDHVGAFQVTFDASPVVSITSPADGATLATGGPVTLTATATDPEDGDLADEIQWESDIDGPLGTGASINVELSLGTHTITATVEDSGGNVATDNLTFTVAPAMAPSEGFPGRRRARLAFARRFR